MLPARYDTVRVQSHLTRGAWIEIMQPQLPPAAPAGRTSHEVRGLKSRIVENVRLLKRRTSHEVRGLKLKQLRIQSLYKVVAPHTRCVD